MGTRFGRLVVIAILGTLALFAGQLSGADEKLVLTGKKACELSAREVVERFGEMFYGQKKVREAFERWVHPEYIQHKPTLPDGREPVINFLEKLLERFPQRTFTIY